LEPNKTTLAQFLDRWLDAVKPRVSPRTHERYCEIARKNIVPLLGGLPLSVLRPHHITAAYAKALESGRRDGEGGLAPRSVHHMHRILAQALAQAVRWEVLVRNPTDAVDPPKPERKAMKTIDLSQTVNLIERIRGTSMLVPTLFAVLCGMRRGEIAALRWKNLDLDNKKIAVAESAEQTHAGVRLKPPKNGKGRSVTLSNTMVEELRAHRIEQAQQLLRLGTRLSDDTFVCALADGTPMQPNYITHAWTKLVARTGLKRLRFHDLRHSHATHLLASDVHPKVASERLGHSKVGITLDLYSHVLPGMQEDAVARVDDALRKAKTTL
jgi:integrase